MRHGFLLIDKPVGPTSHDSVHAVRKRLHEKSVGHIGTLDPAASGLLVLAVGAKALKVIEFFQNMPKEYVAEITFGAVSTTYDRDGVIEKVEPKPGWSAPDMLQLRRLIDEKFIGTIRQKPPAHSAIHIGGVRAYEFARKGEHIVMEDRTVRIDACEILKYEYPKLELRVACGSGTYIRSLAHDLGQMARSGAYLSALRRTKAGEWNVSNAVSSDECSWTDIVPLKDILKNAGGVDINADEMEHVKHGRTIARHILVDTFAWHEGLPVAVLTPVPNGSRPRKVL